MLTITETIRRAMAADSIENPTPAQTQAFEGILAGRHVLIHAATGTGKTLAYLLPVLQRLREEEGRAVVIAPGAELAMQTLRVANAYKDEDLTASAAVSTTSSKRQRKRVQQSTRLIVGTPDRVMELFERRKLKGVKVLVLDELDPILASRHAETLHQWLSRSEPKMQIIIATATLSSRADAFIAQFLPDGVRIEASAAPMQDAISHHVVRVRSGKEVVLARFIEQNRCKRAIVFASDTRHQSHLFHFLSEHGIVAATVSRDRSKQQRQQGLDAFRSGSARVLITTDAAARGLDVPDVAWVLHYDVPRSAQAYVHRAGRTGRAGKRGHSVVFVDDTSVGALRRLEHQLSVPFTRFPEGRTR